MKNTFLRPGMMVLIATAFLAGCATTSDWPVADLTRAESAIEFAEENGAREFGSQALDQARDKLTAAKRAADQGEHDVATQLAKESQLDAELAAAKASRAKTEQSLNEIQESIQTIRAEIARNSGI
jgi:septal ring factor EnvC (AmiA/AmiB activator)